MLQGKQISHADQLTVNATLFIAIRKKPGKISEEDRCNKVEQILNEGANINAQDKNDQDNTVLHISIKNNYPEIVKFLLEKGAKINILNSEGKSCFALAVEQENWTIIKILNKSANVPPDGNCLFWAVALGYLISVKNDNNLFTDRFKMLFGQENLQYLSLVQDAIKNYNPFISHDNITNDTILTKLVTRKFRKKVVEYMRLNPIKFQQSLEGETGLPFDEYLDKMNVSEEWGDEPEIAAMRELLRCTIKVHSSSTSTYESTGSNQIELYHENLAADTRSSYITSSNRNHYNFSVEAKIIDDYQRLVPSKDTGQQMTYDDLVSIKERIPTVNHSNDVLKKDSEIKYSNGKLRETITSALDKEGFCGKTNIDEFKLVADYPTPYIFAILAKKVYKTYDKEYERDLPEDWRVLTTATNKGTSNGYCGAAYWNAKHQQVVIAHQGIKMPNFGTIWTNLKGVVLNKYVAQMESAVTFTDWITSLLNEINRERQTNFQLFFTGHSIGGWLAQITTFTAKYLTLINDNIFGKANFEGYHAHTVVFDSPGCKDMLNKLQESFFLRRENSCILPIDTLDITSYLSSPNIINTRNSHIGTVYRIFVDLSDVTFGEKNILMNNLVAHKMRRIMHTFAYKDLKIKQVIDWPICKGLSIKELMRFVKWVNNLNYCDPVVESYPCHSSIRYQVKDVEENILNANFFTQSERLFLGRYQQLRKFPDILKLHNLFSNFKDEDIKKITETLQYFKIESYRIICRDKNELQKLIPCVKTLLYLLPEIQIKIGKALTDIDIMDKIIQSHFLNYSEYLKKRFQDFTDDKKLKDLIGDTKQVLFISGDGDTSVSLIRIYKAFVENVTYDVTKVIVLSLEKLLYLQELLHSKEVIKFVEVLCKNKSLILVECTLNYNVEHNKDIIGEFFESIFRKLQCKSESKIIFVTHRSNNNNLINILSSKAHELQLDDGVKELMPLKWDNLSKEFQENLIKKPLIVIQGNVTSLKELIGHNNADYTHIDPEQEILMKLINNDEFVVERKLSPISCDASCYIERTFIYKTEIKMDIFKKQDNDFLFISGVDKAHLESLGLARNKMRLFYESDPDKNCLKFIVSDNQQAEHYFKQLCTKYPHDNIHWVRIESDKLIWYKSKGAISSLQQYIERSEINAKEYSEKELLNKNSDVIIICGTAGIGKSMTLTSLLLKIKKQDPASLLIRIDLNNYIHQLHKQKEKNGFKTIDAAIQFLAQDLVKFSNSSQQFLFQCYCLRNIGKMLVMLDGIDAISPDYKDITFELIQALKNSTIKQIWITARPNMRGELEDKFQQFAFTLKRFSEEDQQEFLTKFWEQNLNLSNEIKKEKLQIYAKELIKILAKSISDKNLEFTSIPLQTKILAEVYSKDMVKFCTSEETKQLLPENLHLDLYKRFFKLKYDVYLLEKNQLDFNKPRMRRPYDELYFKFIDQQQDIALYALFKESELEILLREKLNRKCRKSNPDQHEEQNQLPFQIIFNDEIQKFACLTNDIKEGKVNFGIIDQVIEDKPHFIHRSIAEYLVARFLLNSLNQQMLEKIPKFLLQEILLKPNYQGIRAFFNSYLEKATILESTLIEYGNQLKELWESDNQREYFNEDGKTVIHVAAEENNERVIGFILNSLNKSQNTQFLETLINVKDHRGMTSLHLAATTGHFDIIKLLVEEGANFDAINDDRQTVLICAIKNKHMDIAQWLENRDTCSLLYPESISTNPR